MWVLIDNYDSFTHILLHYLLQAGGDCRVYRNDALTLQELIDLAPERLIISPGPETPLQAGITMEAIAHFYSRIPLLGICLGHQAIGMHFGMKLVHAPSPVHGKTSAVFHNHHPLFHDIMAPFTAMRYHSLAVTDIKDTGLKTIAATEDGTVMALAHEEYPCIGMQFHPESAGTPHGQQLLQNWAAMYP